MLHSPWASRRLSQHPTWILGAVLASSIAVADSEGRDEAFSQDLTGADIRWGPCPEFMPEGCGLAVLQGDPAERNADVLFRLAGNTTADRHWHTSVERMVLISGELHVAYDGREPVVMTPGTYAYGPARLPHSAECRSDDECILFIAFEEHVDATPGAPD
jgi:mannose-6-phosphate isomerase-like protein (cupin superfamily)